MQPDLYTKYELSQVKEDLKALDFKYSPVETRPVIVDFSEPFKANQWIEEMRGASPNPRPAGIIGQIKYYKEGQGGNDHNTYQFLLSSNNNQAAITDLLNFECRTPKTTTEDASTYQTTEYYDIVDVMRGQPDEAVKFATNILRLIKGTSFSRKEKGLIGLKKTIDCSLDFVAILFTAECLRDPRSKYLAMSELYKLKKEEIDIDALFHPIHGRYVPARIIEAKFLEKFATKWKPIPEKDRSKIEPNFSKGGAQQMRDVSDKQIREHYFDEKMQSYYQIHEKSPGKDESLLREKIQDIEEDWERYEEKFKEKRDELIKKEKEALETAIKGFEENLKGKEKQKAIAERKLLSEAAIEYAEEDYELRSKDLKKEHNWDKFQDARQKLEELKDYSFLGFRFWVLEKFEKAQLICQNIKNK